MSYTVRIMPRAGTLEEGSFPESRFHNRLKRIIKHASLRKPW
jgi:hypothetical protein